MDILQIVRSLAPVKGRRLTEYLQRFLLATPDALAQWQGKFTEVVTAKAVDILRRRGVMEELEVRQDNFGVLVNAVYRAPAVRAGANGDIGQDEEQEVPRPRRERRW